MKKKMIIFDLDGTLLNKEKKINDSSIKVLKEIIKQGHYVCIATGRTLQEYVEEIIDLIGIDTYVINVNGNFIYDIKTKTTRCVGQPVSQAVVNAFKEKAMEVRRQLIAYNSLGTVKRYYFGTTQENDITDVDYFLNGIDVNEFDDLSGLDFFLNDPNHKIVHIGIKSEKDTSQDLFKALSAFEKVSLAHITLVSKVFVDADAIGINKWSAIQVIANELNVDLDDIYTFGDSDNDLEMLLNSKHAYCMGNALDNMKQHFRPEQIIGDNGTDAIAEVLSKEFNVKY